MTLNLRLDHFTVLTDDLDTTVAFYRDVLGLTPGPRPAMNSDGVWLYSGDKAVLHIIVRDRLPEERRGILDHMAFRADDLDGLIEKLKAQGIDYRLIQTPEPWQQWQLFFDGPNGERVEVDCKFKIRENGFRDR